jgi:hypothetical protein
MRGSSMSWPTISRLASLSITPRRPRASRSSKRAMTTEIGLEACILDSAGKLPASDSSAEPSQRVNPTSPFYVPRLPQRSLAVGDEGDGPVLHAEDMNRVLTIALLTVAVLVPASVASAASAAASRTSKTYQVRTARASVTSRNPVTTAFAIAEGYWGAVPCAGQVKIVANRPLAPGLDPSTDGWVTFGSSLGADNLGAPASTYNHCPISLAHWQWASWTQMETDWGMFCLTVIHETGHLLGQKHSLVPRSVMAPVFTNYANVPAVCDATWLAAWRSR